MQNTIRKAFGVALLAAATFGVSLIAGAVGGTAPGKHARPPDGAPTATSAKTTTARLGSLRRDDVVVVAVEGVVDGTELARGLSALRDAMVSREAVQSGFTEWTVTPSRTVTGDIVVGLASDPSPWAVTRNWSLFYANDTVRDANSRLADVKRTAYNETNIVWSASETKLGVVVVASRVQVPTVADIARLQAGVDACNDGVDIAYERLMGYATNNYWSAYLANDRVKAVEAWQHTNALMRTDLETGLTGWAVTPRWPVGYMEVCQFDDGPYAGKWALFSPADTVHSVDTAITSPVAGVTDRYGNVVELTWPGVQWRVEARWTNSLHKLGLPWTPNPGNGYVTAHFDVRATRTRIPTMADIPTLVGESYDFSSNDNIVRAVADIVRALGGSVTNVPPTCKKESRATRVGPL